MSRLLLHPMDAAWLSSNPALFAVTVDPHTSAGPSPGSLRLAVSPGAAGTEALFEPVEPFDLSSYEELRFWIRAERRADGSPAHPFYLELSYDDAGDLPAEEHRWLVPVNRSGVWEQRRIGIENERRDAVVRFRWTSLDARPFTCHLDELLAVREELLDDVEEALVERLTEDLSMSWLAGIAVSADAAAGTATVVVPMTPALAAGSRVLVAGGDAGDEEHELGSVTHDEPGDTSSLELTGSLAGNLTAGVASVTVLVPVIVEAPPSPTEGPTPAIVVTHLDLREDLGRGGIFTQRDSFRRRGDLTVCSTRPAPRPYLVDYQIHAVAPRRREQRFLQAEVASRFSLERGLRINGASSPVATLAPPALDEREPGDRAPLYVRVGTRREVSPRHEATPAFHGELAAAHRDAPEQRERIVIEP